MMRLLGTAVAVLLVTASVYGSDDDASTSPSAATAPATTASTTSLDEAEPSTTAAAGDGSTWSGPSVNRQPADDDVAAHW
jgi:hypothetical protein